MNCPKCIGKLSKVELKSFEIFDTNKGEEITMALEVDQCFVCNGVWFDAGELEKYIEKKMLVLDSPPIDIELMEKLDKKTAKCPRCNIDMVKKEAPKNKNVIIDFCEKCHGIWLDSREIDRIETKNISLLEKVGILIKNLIPRRY